MKTRYRFIHFVEAEMWECRSNKTEDILGYVFWFTEWKQFVFSQAKENCIFSVDCLNDIADFMRALNIKVTP